MEHFKCTSGEISRSVAGGAVKLFDAEHDAETEVFSKTASVTKFKGRFAVPLQKGVIPHDLENWSTVEVTEGEYAGYKGFFRNKLN